MRPLGPTKKRRQVPSSNHCNQKIQRQLQQNINRSQQRQQKQRNTSHSHNSGSRGNTGPTTNCRRPGNGRRESGPAARGNVGIGRTTSTASARGKGHRPATGSRNGDNRRAAVYTRQPRNTTRRRSYLRGGFEKPPASKRPIS